MAVPIYLPRKAWGDRGGVVVLAGFVCIQTADNKEARLREITGAARAARLNGELERCACVLHTWLIVSARALFFSLIFPSFFLLLPERKVLTAC